MTPDSAAINERLTTIEGRVDSLLSIPSSRKSAPESDEVGLSDILSIFWQGKWVVFLFTIIFAIGSLGYALSQRNVYASSALLAPSEESGGSSGLSGQLGGLASLAGVSLSSGGTGSVAIAIEVIKTRRFAEKLISKYDMLVPLMAVVGWKDGKPLINSETYDQVSDRWVTKPSDQQAYERFLSLVNVKQNKKTSLVTIEVEHYSPEIAKQWVDWIVIEINDVMRTKDVNEASKSIAYLNRELKKTNIAEMHNVFFQLIEDQTKKMMLAEIRDDYVFFVIDGAVVPERKLKPSRSSICIVGTGVGFFFGLFLIFVIHIGKILIAEQRKLGIDQ
ncbi:MAG: LPS O-antigen length regulator [Agarilytica sp.]